MAVGAISPRSSSGLGPCNAETGGSPIWRRSSMKPPHGNRGAMRPRKALTGSSRPMMPESNSNVSTHKCKIDRALGSPAMHHTVHWGANYFDERRRHDTVDRLTSRIEYLG